MQLRMLRHVRLNEHRAYLRIESGSEIVEHHVDRALLYRGRIGVVAGKRMPIGDEEIRVVLVLQLYPVSERTDVVAQMQLARRTHTAQDALPASCATLVVRGNGGFSRGLIHQSLSDSKRTSKILITDPSTAPRKFPPNSTSSHSREMPAISNPRRNPSGRKWRIT